MTQAEREAIETADAQWVRPPQGFIDLFNTAAGDYGGYNEETGFFELNGIIDIGYNEAVNIYEFAYLKWPNPKPFIFHIKVRTNLVRPLAAGDYNKQAAGGLGSISNQCFNLEVIRVCGDTETVITSISYMTLNTHKLRAVKGVIHSMDNGPIYLDMDTGILEEIWVKSLKASVKMNKQKKIRRDCLAFMVQNSANTTSITITVHPDVYAKLTGDTDNAAAAVLTSEELEAWQQVLADAADKNILFATA